MESFNPEKVIVLDDRIASSYKQQYALNVGPDTSRINFTNASSNTASQLQFTVQNADITTRIDSHMYLQTNINAFVDIQYTVDTTGTDGQLNIPATRSLIVFGKDAGLRPFPFNLECVNNNSCVMANETFTLSSADINDYIFRMMDTEKLYQERTCPSSLDRFVDYSSISNTAGGMNTLATYLDSGNNRINNSSYSIVLCKPDGSVLKTDTPAVCGSSLIQNYTDYKYTAATNLLAPASAIAINGNYTFRIYYKIVNLTEPCIVNPWSWDEPLDLHKSFHDIQNFTTTFNLNNSVALLGQLNVSSNSASTFTILRQGLNTSVTGGSPFDDPKLINYYYSLPLVVKDNMPCVRPYLEFNKNIATNSSVTNAGTTGSILSPVIPLNGVDDMLLIGVQPVSYSNGAVESTWFCPIQSVSITWGTQENLLSSFTPTELYKISYKNGLKMNWIEFSGYANTAIANTNLPVATCSSFIVLKPGLDFNIGDAVCGQSINKNLQIRVNYLNQSNWDITAQLKVITVTSCYAVFDNAKCNVVKYPVKPDDLFSASEVVQHSTLKRMVGAGVMKMSANNLMLRQHKKAPKHGGSPHSGGSYGGDAGGDAGGRKHSKRHSRKTAKSRAK